jgi:hypothetical protein
MYGTASYTTEFNVGRRIICQQIIVSYILSRYSTVDNSLYNGDIHWEGVPCHTVDILTQM